MAPRPVPPETLVMLSPIQVAPKFRPLLASPSCHSLNHFGASHSAALSSLAPANALVLAKAHTSAIAATLRSGDLSAVPFTAGALLENARAPHEQIGGTDRRGHQHRRPEKSALDVGQRQALGVHA